MLKLVVSATRGRSLLAARPIKHGEKLLDCHPIASVVKQHPELVNLCARCVRDLDPTNTGPQSRTSTKQAETDAVHPSSPGPGNTSLNNRSDTGTLIEDRQLATPFCSDACRAEATANGWDFLARCDLTPLHQLHREEGRKFPLLVAQLLAGLLAGLKQIGKPPSAWQDAMLLCHSNMHDEAMPQVRREHASLLGAFADAGVAPLSTLNVLLPLSRYSQLLGACQLNAFELRLRHGAVVSCLLPASASFFNHSCEPNVLIDVAQTTRVGFIAANDVDEGDELCISYCELGLACDERQHLFHYKYGFACELCDAKPATQAGQV